MKQPYLLSIAAVVTAVYLSCLVFRANSSDAA
jgi:hypothetical protein